MKRQKNSGGYTIVETMMFLIISGTILVSSMLFFRGRQGRVQFTQGVVEIESNIKTIMNEVTSGYYPNSGSFSCTASAGGLPMISTSVSEEQGKNEECIFFGKALNFTTGADYSAYTILGRRKSVLDETRLATKLEETKPEIFSSIVESYKLPWGITVSGVESKRNSGTVGEPKGSVGLIMTLGEYSSGGGDILAGSQNVDLYPLGASVGEDFNTLQTNVRGMVDSQRRPDKICLYLKSGGGDRNATIILGGDGKQLNTQYILDSTHKECN